MALRAPATHEFLSLLGARRDRLHSRPLVDAAAMAMALLLEPGAERLAPKCQVCVMNDGNSNPGNGIQVELRH